jgi:hypothetical protein
MIVFGMGFEPEEIVFKPEKSASWIRKASSYEGEGFWVRKAN